MVRNADVECYRYDVCRDPPHAYDLQVPSLAIAGFPVLGTVECEFTDCVEWQWHCAGRMVGTACTYVPTEGDMGQTLSVTCVPLRGGHRGRAVHAECEHPVIGVHPAVFEPLRRRVAGLGARPEGPGLRVVTYNILWGISDRTVERRGYTCAVQKDAPRPRAADRLGNQAGSPTGHPTGNGSRQTASCRAGEERALGALPSAGAIRPAPDAPYIATASELPVSILAKDYRQHVLSHELCGYGADLICLQEATPPMVDRFLLPMMARVGYDGRRDALSGELVVLWNRNRFRVTQEATWHIGSLLDSPGNDELRSALQCARHIEAKLRVQPHDAQVMALRCLQTGRVVVLVNVHLLMSRVGANVRAIQALLVLRQLKQWVGFTSVSPEPNVIVCGDFNARGSPASVLPGAASLEMVLMLLTKGRVPATHYEFVYGRNVGRDPVAPCDEERCAAPIGAAGRCPMPVQPGTHRCWDHTCPCCTAAKENKDAVCGACASAGAEPPPFPGKDLFASDLELPSAPFESAYEKCTGSHALFTAPFLPKTGEPSPIPFVEMKDHIFVKSGGIYPLRPTAALPPPALDTIRGALPSLCWPSDHMALVADFEWT